MIELTVNGEPVSLDGPVTIADFLASRGIHTQMVVVERNGEIVPRPEFTEVVLKPGDRLEIVQMMAGG
ncbi:MAG: sulfur carrier protein ThiS [Chthonomonadales bacterium]